MRITGGTALNRKLRTPGSGRSEYIRPTGDRVREAIFSMLGDIVAQARILDLFAGTGSLGLEALSRGASSAVFVDRHPHALELIRTNIRACFRRADVELVRLNLATDSAYRTLQKRISGSNIFDIIFLDPPYEKKLAEMALTMVDKTGLLAPGGYAVTEERSNVDLPEKIGSLHLHKKKCYGETGIWIYQAELNQEKANR